jgi:hypothetical protein
MGFSKRMARGINPTYEDHPILSAVVEYALTAL